MLAAPHWSPALELASLRKLRGEDQGVEARLVDDNRLTLVVRTSVANRDGGFVLLINVLSYGIARIAVPQHLSHILTHEPNLQYASAQGRILKTSRWGGY